ncbi:jg25037 [Pararge aegeria aegeria]|uniref:Jg25037 protein n=1 Tax=Pararge aegeria aegeria TaxID=348720 RepID=A0A8S4QG41_9NEOP|nr:jg25037 [Pararge aegeria aegeria]
MGGSGGGSELVTLQAVRDAMAPCNTTLQDLLKFVYRHHYPRHIDGATYHHHNFFLHILMDQADGPSDGKWKLSPRNKASLHRACK